jgi:hypothetical protein
MDTYILRIYRRGAAASEAVHGTLERAGARERAAFASRDELWALLSASAPPDEASSQPPDTEKSNR